MGANFNGYGFGWQLVGGSLFGTLCAAFGWGRRGLFFRLEQAAPSDVN
jgi:hypothetical protein